MKANTITASIDMPEGTVSAEFQIDTGRLRILERGTLRVECFPPQSWFTIASVAGNSRWGTRPRERDLHLVAENFILQRFGMSAYRGETTVTCEPHTAPGSRPAVVRSLA